MEQLNPEASSSSRKPLFPWVWTPLIIGLAGLGALLLDSYFPGAGKVIGWFFVACVGGVLLYFLAQTIARLTEKRWLAALAGFSRLLALAVLTFLTLVVLIFQTMFGPSEDNFADNLHIPDDIEIAEPIADPSGRWSDPDLVGTDAMQIAVKAALVLPGGKNSSFVAALPSLRRAATNFPKDFQAYIEASPNWHVFFDQGNRFAARRWSYGGEPRDELHGYISEFGGNKGFQTRVLLCLDRKQWSSYDVQQVPEGNGVIFPEMSGGNDMRESLLKAVSQEFIKFLTRSIQVNPG